MRPPRLLVAVLVLVGTQMLMLIYTKRATSSARLPLLLCLAQFSASALLAGACSLFSAGAALPWAPRSLWVVIAPLSLVWTAGFVLFNASATLMSPALVSLVRCMEPLATVCVGFAVGSECYSLRVLATLVPICGGVILASSTGGSLSAGGACLALLSNVCFSLRPFFKRRLKTHPANTLDTMGEFFNVTLIASVALLPPAVALLEGAALQPALSRLSDAGQLMRFGVDVALSSVCFFLYQYTQMAIMSSLSPLAFSVLTPVVKALMIVACSYWFGDPFTALTAIGVVLSAGGGYLFSQVLAAEQKRAPAAPKLR